MQKNDRVTSSAFSETFYTNVQNIINSALSSEKEVPNMSGKGGINIIAGNSDQAATSSTPNLPSGDLDSVNNALLDAKNILNSNLPDKSKVTGTTVYNAMCKAYQALNRIHAYTTEWRFNNHGNSELIARVSGKGVFKDTMPSLPAGWTSSTRNGKQNVSLSENTLTNNKNITVDNVMDQINALTNSWNSSMNIGHSYTYSTCHSNCHSNCHQNCHSSRSRR